ncbi:PUR family DNA/RNA-binding protein [Kiritimatiella glycovorans]|uniref:PurA ssDNA and RNA-binding protein n=1 Tax=Kiritimatiella glycovorans TaxID=1307763 RepID=A0A0G3EGW3_9BACT|nr:PUR family DNA/RNA-binding protein [Kiritimatiella glycovorans]AKJ64662.1 PurA ssDNA and RNA-binding protein [Kiritimatiella glycovorans]
MEQTLMSEHLQVERKQFFLDLKENQRGSFLRITEDVKGRRDTIIIPASGLPLLRDALDKMVREKGPFGNPEAAEPA